MLIGRSGGCANESAKFVVTTGSNQSELHLFPAGLRNSRKASSNSLR